MTAGDPPARLDSAAVHTLSNHLAVILGFVELVLADTPADDPRRTDLVEIREAALAAAALLGHPPAPADPPAGAPRQG